MVLSSGVVKCQLDFVWLCRNLQAYLIGHFSVLLLLYLEQQLGFLAARLKGFLYLEAEQQSYAITKCLLGHYIFLQYGHVLQGVLQLAKMPCGRVADHS